MFERQADVSDDWRHEAGGLVKAYLRSPRRELSRSTLVHLSVTRRDQGCDKPLILLIIESLVRAGIKDLVSTRAGVTTTLLFRFYSVPLPGFKPAQPVVFCGLFPVDAADFEALRDAIEKLSLNDASFSSEMETSAALGFGFRCGFLGLLHLEVIRDRLEREAAALRERFDTTLPRFDMMATLHRHPDGLTMSALSEALLVSNGNVTQVAYEAQLINAIINLRAPLAKRLRAAYSGAGQTRRMTIVGDIAQSTGAWPHASWDEIVDLLPQRREPRRAELTVGALGLVVGQSYPMDIFHAERHTTASNFRVETTIDCFVVD